jgi:hypothetical protein
VKEFFAAQVVHAFKLFTRLKPIAFTQRKFLVVLWNNLKPVVAMRSSVKYHACWCGNSRLKGFNTEYSQCLSCGTLIALKPLSGGGMNVSYEDEGIYGKKYWLDHQRDDLGFPDIYTRSRNDLTERNLHWLKTLMKYLRLVVLMQVLSH